MRYQRGRKEPRRSAAGLDAAWKKLEEAEEQRAQQFVRGKKR